MFKINYVWFLLTVLPNGSYSLSVVIPILLVVVFHSVYSLLVVRGLHCLFIIDYCIKILFYQVLCMQIRYKTVHVCCEQKEVVLFILLLWIKQFFKFGKSCGQKNTQLNIHKNGHVGAPQLLKLKDVWSRVRSAAVHYYSHMNTSAFTAFVFMVISI